MKRLLSLLLALLLLSGCGAPAQPTAATEPPTVPTVPTQGTETPIPEGYNRLTFYWKGEADLSKCDIWIWLPNQAGKGHLFTECDYGGKVTLDVPQGVTEVGFIVRRDCSAPGGSDWGSATKDYENDRFAQIGGRETEVYLLSGDPNQYISNDGGKTLDMAKKFEMVTMADETVVRYRITPKTALTLDMLRLYRDGREIPLKSLSTDGKEASQGEITLAEPLNLSGNYKLVIQGYGEKTVLPMDIFDSQWFAENYHYDGDDLGAVISGDTTTFKVWAPTASEVLLNLFEAGDGVEAYKRVPMTLGDKGVWSHTEACGHGTYYTYTVTTAVGTQEAVDIYAKAAGLNGDRGMVVDLDSTDPAAWDETPITLDAYADAIIWEVHVRDFSNRIAASQYKGKYLAFTETGLVNEHGQAVGVDYLKELGITHVHLLPVYDYATVNEADPDSGFNWGYDPKNYNVPEGSYSTDPYRGQIRITEYKQMVQALHEAGIGVIMDMVYNHTYDGNSSFNKLVPYYYYRFDRTGAFTSASGCGNDTASERYMFGKFMVDSTAYWVQEYRLDGLRFDLMGLHDLATMQAVEEAVHAVNPSAILYGEGWTMGATLDGSKQADQRNISELTAHGAGAVAVFSDVVRDGLKGSVFEKTGRGFINGAPTPAAVQDVIFGISGGQGVGQGWSVTDSMVINYMSAHDNNTLWDKLLLSNADASDEERLAMNKLGAAVLMVSKGTPFWQAGEEMLRTKGGDENSYKSSDAVNNIDWSVLQPGTLQHAAMEYYKGLIALRKANPVFGAPATEVTAETLSSGILAVHLKLEDQEALVLLNPQGTALPYTLEGNWKLLCDAETAGTEVLAQESGTVQLAPTSARIYIN